MIGQFKKYCKRGHLRTPESVYAQSQGCKICQKENMARWRQRPLEARAFRKEFCKRGHPRTPLTITQNANCRACVREYYYAYYRREGRVFEFFQLDAAILPVEEAL